LLKKNENNKQARKHKSLKKENNEIMVGEGYGEIKNWFSTLVHRVNRNRRPAKAKVKDRC